VFGFGHTIDASPSRMPETALERLRVAEQSAEVYMRFLDIQFLTALIQNLDADL
jgi:hypothetical protein